MFDGARDPDGRAGGSDRAESLANQLDDRQDFAGCHVGTRNAMREPHAPAVNMEADFGIGLKIAQVLKSNLLGQSN